MPIKLFKKRGLLRLDHMNASGSLWSFLSYGPYIPCWAGDRAVQMTPETAWHAHMLQFTNPALPHINAHLKELDTETTLRTTSWAKAELLLDFLVLIFWFRVVFVWYFMPFQSVAPLMVFHWTWNTPIKELSRRQPHTPRTALYSESGPECPFHSVSWFLFLPLKFPEEHQFMWQRPSPDQPLARSSSSSKELPLSLVPPDTGWD